MRRLSRLLAVLLSCTLMLCACGQQETTAGQDTPAGGLFTATLNPVFDREEAPKHEPQYVLHGAPADNFGPHPTLPAQESFLQLAADGRIETVELVAQSINPLKECRFPNAWFYSVDGKQGIVNQNGKILTDYSNDLVGCNTCDVRPRSAHFTLADTYNAFFEFGHGLSSSFYYSLADQTYYLEGDCEAAHPTQPVLHSGHMAPVTVCTEKPHYVEIGPQQTALRYNAAGLYQIIGKTGPLTDRDVEAFYNFVLLEDGTAVMPVCRGGNWQFLKEDGALLFDAAFKDARNFYDGYAPVKLHGKWGYIDLSGSPVTPFLYEEARPLQGGKTFVKLGGIWQAVSLDLL